MRIRKNAETQTILEPHFCQLNQSPWDIISFSSSHSQLECEDNSFTSANTSFAHHSTELGDNGVVSSVDGEDIVTDNDKEERQMGLNIERDEMLVYCNKTDGKQWHCKNLAKRGHSMCEHHLNQLKSYSYYNKKKDGGGSSTSVSAAKKLATVKRVRQARSVNKKGTGNPYEFYYYSGFGPKWGKRRSDSRDDVDGSESESRFSSMKSGNEEIEYVGDDDDDDEEIEDNVIEKNKKKMRKPVKARSLKSLL